MQQFPQFVVFTGTQVLKPGHLTLQPVLAALLR